MTEPWLTWIMMSCCTSTIYRLLSYTVLHRQQLQQQHFKCIKFHIKLDISSSESEYVFKKVEVIRMFYSYYINNSYDLHLFGVKIVQYVAWEGNHFSFIACLSRKFTSGNSSYHARCLLSVCLLQNQNIIDKTDLCNSFRCKSRFHRDREHKHRETDNWLGQYNVKNFNAHTHGIDLITFLYTHIHV